MPNIVEQAMATFDMKSEVGQQQFDRWYRSLPRGDRVVVDAVPTRRAKVPAKRVVDRRIWAKLNDRQRGRYLDRVREELNA